MTYEEQQLVDILQFDKPMKQRDIALELRIKGVEVNTRTIREWMKRINQRYIDGEIKFIVASNQHGSFKTSDIGTIHEFNENKRRHALSELYMSYNVNKQASKRDYMTFEEYLEVHANECE